MIIQDENKDLSNSNCDLGNSQLLNELLQS